MLPVSNLVSKAAVSSSILSALKSTAFAVALLANNLAIEVVPFKNVRKASDDVPYLIVNPLESTDTEFLGLCISVDSPRL